MGTLSLETAKFLINEFEKNLCKYSSTTYNINELEKVVILEDDLSLYIGIKFDDLFQTYLVSIEELTYNNLGFKYNHSRFIRDMEQKIGISYLCDVTYTKFKGYSDLAKKINALVPDAKLKQRYTSWEGIKYNFIVIEIDDIAGNVEYGVAYTTQKPTTYINSMCEKIIKRGMYGLGDIRIGTSNFTKAFDSWKGKPRKYRLENHMKYFYLEKYFKEKDDVWRYTYKGLR